MKKALILTTIFFALQASAEFAVEDFNQMIQENQKSEAELRGKLQKDAGIDLKKDQPGKISREKIQIPQEAEEVVVSSGPTWVENGKKTRSSGKALHKSEMKRLSQELKDADSN